MGGILAALFIWATVTGINQEPSHYYISPLVFGLSIASIAVAVSSYFIQLEKFRVVSAFGAYCLLISAISVLVLDTGTANSPFLAVWLIGALFVGAFGSTALFALFIVVNAFNAYLIFTSGYSREILVSIILVAELPIIISYILWHENSKSQSKKDRAYYDLANQLNQESNKSDVVINAISDGVIAINNDGVIELINPAAQRIVGWGHQDAIGLDYKSVLQLLSKDGHELDKSTDPIFDVLATNQPAKTDLQLQTNSGKKLNVEIVVSPIGRLGSGAIIVFRDVTKEQEEERAQAEFISTASHEMRTPVASIEGYLGLALNPATATIDEKARDFITKAHEAAQHLGRLFQDLLDVTKADDGRLSNNPKVINVVEFTSSIIESLLPKADAKKLRIFFKAATPKDEETEGGLRNIVPVFFVDLDADHLREVLSNLVENAIKYTPAGQVVMDVQGDDEHVVISISDSGIGIPAEDIPHLFQKFYRVDNSDTREIGGTGLGLYLCRRLIEAMGGRIWVESEYKKGSTFYVELPRISHEEANRLIEASVATPQQTSQDKVYSLPIPGQTPEEAEELEARQKAALATPIVVSHAATAKDSQPAATATATDTIDPLVGAQAPAAAQTPQVGRQNAMVLPPNLQAIKSNFQQAAKSMAPVPAAAPATASAPQPTPQAIQPPQAAPSSASTPPASQQTPQPAAMPAPQTQPAPQPTPTQNIPQPQPLVVPKR